MSVLLGMPALLLLLGGGALEAQSLQFGRVNVIQNSSADSTAAVTLSIGAGSSGGFHINHDSSDRGHYDLEFGNADDAASGVVICSPAENGRNNSGQGDAFGLFYATTNASPPNGVGDKTRYRLGVRRAAQGDQANMNVSFGYFPFEVFLGGLASNTANNATLSVLQASPGIRLGHEFVNSGTGRYTLNLSALGASSANGILLVCGGKDEDNYALCQAHADGSFTIFCHDNGVDKGSYENDPVAFVYLPLSAAGSNIVALARVRNDATAALGAGAFNLGKGGKGQWHVSAPGYDNSNAVLLVSAAGGTSYNFDNIVSSQWDAANGRWVVESRDLSGDTNLPTLQDSPNADEIMFSFALLSAVSHNQAPQVALTAPAHGATALHAAPVTLTAAASDAENAVLFVDFWVDGERVGKDASAPYSISWTPPAAGDYSVRARVVDKVGQAGWSEAATLHAQPNPNQAPAAQLTAPPAGAAIAGGSVTLTAAISDPENDAVTVTFYGRHAAPANPGPDFTLVTLPDTQFYSQNTGGTRLTHYLNQTNWIVQQRDALNIAFVSHQGDITQDGDLFNNGSSAEQQWINASQAMSLLEAHATTLRAYGIPWGAAPGNHDQEPIGNADGTTTFYNQYFGTSRFLGRPYYGGHYGANNDNNYQLFSASGLDFIAIHLEYDTTPDAAVLDWADALLKAHPHRRAFVTTHHMVNTGNPATFSGQGRAIYDRLKNNPNLFMLLGGHIAGEGRRQDTHQGRTVYSLLQDYQGRSNGGDGWLRYYQFSPANNRITARTYSPSLNQHETDDSSQFVLNYDMQSACMDWVPLGTVSVPAGGGTASLTWTGLEDGKHYEWYAAMSDGINATGSEVRRFATMAEAPPAISLALPANGAVVRAGHAQRMQAVVTAGGAAVQRVEFFDGLTRLGTDSAAPYELLWSPSAGTHQITAVAVDARGRAVLSNVARVTASATAKVPQVQINSPVSGSVVMEGAAVTMTAAAYDPDGVVLKVEFFVDGVKIGEDDTAPYTAVWSAVAGEPVLTAVATDNGGASAESAPVSLSVIESAAAFPVEQNFDSLGGDGTLLPTGWTVVGGLGGDATTWSAASGVPAADVGGGQTNRSVAASTNFNVASDAHGFNFALPSSPADRALGLSPDQQKGVMIQLSAQNQTGRPIYEVEVGYDMRRFTFAGQTNELPGYRLFYSVGQAAWVEVEALRPTSLIGGGVSAPNSVGVTQVAPHRLRLQTPWQSGAVLRLRWVDDNAAQSAPDQVMGLDNVVLRPPPQAVAFSLQLLPFSDAKSGPLTPQAAPYLAALAEAFEKRHAHTLVLADGLFAPGPHLAAGADAALDAWVGESAMGRPDLALRQLIGVEAAVTGAREWELGSWVLAEALGASGAWNGAAFPLLGLNLDGSADAALADRFSPMALDGAATPTPAAAAMKGRIVPAVVVEKGGEKIGLIGVTTPLLEALSFPGGTVVKGDKSLDMTALAALVQPYVDELAAEGVNKVILLAHLPDWEKHVELAGKLSGVDVLLASGPFTRQDAGPVITQGADGAPVLLASTEGESAALGRWIVDFDAQGRVTTHWLEAFAAENGAYAADAATVAAVWGVPPNQLPETAFAPGSRAALARGIAEAIGQVAQSKDGVVRGFSAVYLEGSQEALRREETNLGNLIADAGWRALQATGEGDVVPVVSLRHAGGITASIGGLVSGPEGARKEPPLAHAAAGKPAGAISQLDVENALRGRGVLMAFETDVAGLKTLLEHGLTGGAGEGRFPQVGGVVFAWDPQRPAGERVTAIALMEDDGSAGQALYASGDLQAAVAAAAPPVLRVVCTNGLANGAEDYPAKAVGWDFRFLLDSGGAGPVIENAMADLESAAVIPANALSEQAALARHLQALHPDAARAFASAETPVTADHRIQNLQLREPALPVLLEEDSDGDGLSDAIERLIGGLPAAPWRAGDAVDLNLRALAGGEAVLRLQGRLPKGLVFDAKTGRLSGVLRAAPGSYELQLQALSGKQVAAVWTLRLGVEAFPAGLAGNYEGLLKKDDGGVWGVVRLALSKSLTWSATLDAAGQPRRSARGRYALLPGEPAVQLELPFKATKTHEAVLAEVLLDEAASLQQGRFQSGAVTGEWSGLRVAAPAEGPPAARRLTFLLDQGPQDGMSHPAGLGWLTGQMSRKGRMTLKGRLGDAQAVSFPVRLSQSGQALLWAKPYRNKLSYFGGVATLPDLGQAAVSAQRLAAGCLWWREPDTREACYPVGFTEILPVTAKAAPVPAARSFAELRSQWGMANGRLQVRLSGAGLDGALPEELTLDDKGRLQVSLPAPPAALPWSAALKRSSAAWSGWLQRAEGRAAVSGVIGDFEGRLGGGLLRVPVSGSKQFRTAAVELKRAEPR